MHPESNVKTRALHALRAAFMRQHPGALVDEKGYASHFHEVLLPQVSADDFEADMRAGDGQELETKFRAAHSSSALAVNAFAPFRRRMADFTLPFGGEFETLSFERKCPTGLRGGRSPNLDVLLSGPDCVVGIESKLTEYLAAHPAKFSDAYAEQICDERCEQGYFQEMLRLMKQPGSYSFLDAAQLIKHAFGLANNFRGRPVILLYLFWEPANANEFPVFAAHRQEVDAFSEKMAVSKPAFKAMSYNELWHYWRGCRNVPEWLSVHIDAMQGRYHIAI